MRCGVLDEKKVKYGMHWHWGNQTKGKEETWKCQSCWKCIRFYFPCKRNTGCRVYFKGLFCRTAGSPAENFLSGTAMNTDCASHLIISNIQRICSLEHQWLQKELFILLFYWSPPPPHHHHFLQLFSFWCRLMVVLSLSPRPRSVPLFQPNEDGCSGKTVQMYVVAAGIGTGPFVKTNMVGAVVSSPVGPLGMQE